MDKLKKQLIGFGFVWIFCASIVGSLLGARIQLLISKKTNLDWLASLQKHLLTSAHAHMNLMAITSILMGITIPFLRSCLTLKQGQQLCYTHVFSALLFGLSLCLEAFYPTKEGSLSWPSYLTATGGILYMATVLLYGCLFLALDRK